MITLCLFHWRSPNTAFHLDFDVLVLGFKVLNFLRNVAAILIMKDPDIYYSFANRGYHIGRYTSFNSSYIHGYSPFHIIHGIELLYLM